MRRFDKAKHIERANILSEQRHAAKNSLIKEYGEENQNQSSRIKDDAEKIIRYNVLITLNEVTAFMVGWYLSSGMEPHKDQRAQLNVHKYSNIRPSYLDNLPDTEDETLKNFFKRSAQHFGITKKPTGNLGIDALTVLKAFMLNGSTGLEGIKYDQETIKQLQGNADRLIKSQMGVDVGQFLRNIT